MNTVRFVKSFSKGQITVPKEFRDAFGIKDDFWLKLYIESGKIIAEPVEKERDQSDYLKKLLGIKGGWISEKEIKKNREVVERKLKKRTL
jgi:bifunctional DNA-binding transcriptional regulator/antitoxin component of YhaV-PrlF toxin-antitoxin module